MLRNMSLEDFTDKMKLWADDAALIAEENELEELICQYEASINRVGSEIKWEKSFGDEDLA